MHIDWLERPMVNVCHEEHGVPINHLVLVFGSPRLIIARRPRTLLEKKELDADQMKQFEEAHLKI